MRTRFLVSSGLLMLGACIEVPAGPAREADLLGDAGLELGAALDGGARRPPTSAPYLGPQCDVSEPEPSVVVAGDGGGAFVPGPGDEGAGAPGSEMAAGGAAAPPGTGPMTGAVAARRAGQLVISELMTNPAALRDDDGEWVELYNPSPEHAVALDGCALDDGGAQRALMDGLRVPALAAIALARSEQVGFAPAQLVSVSLANGADSVALICAGAVIDRVSYGAGFPLVAGASMSLDRGALDAFANDAPEVWCAGKTPDAIGELGTPGEVNPSCRDALPEMMDGDRDAGS